VTTGKNAVSLRRATELKGNESWKQEKVEGVQKTREKKEGKEAGQ